MTVRIDAPAAGVRRILIDRPEARNAVDFDTRVALIDAVEAARDAADVRAIVLGGANGMFSAGGDLPSMIGLDREAALARLQHGHRLAGALWEFPKPYVVAVERFAAGAAAGLALAADEVVVGRNAQFLFPFLRLGLVPDWGLMGSLKLRVGLARASRILRDSKAIKGEAALELGIADRMVEDEEVMASAIAAAETLAKLPLGAFAAMKRIMRGDAGTALSLAAEAEAQADRIVSAEFAEGYAAFREKRDPDFS